LKIKNLSSAIPLPAIEQFRDHVSASRKPTQRIWALFQHSSFNSMPAAKNSTWFAFAANSKNPRPRDPRLRQGK
jgi:hypothetical protein